MSELAPLEKKLVYFTIDASICNLHIGDVVYPHTLIGYDFQTGEEITAGCTGRVEKVVFLGPDHTLVVAVRPEE